MKRWMNVLSQIVLNAGQIVNLAEPLLSKEQKVFVAVALGFLTLAVSAIAHEYNTNGTPQETPYIPKQG